LQKGSLFYSFAMAVQTIIFFLESLAVYMLFLIDPMQFKEYLKTSGIKLSTLNKLFFLILSPFQSPKIRLATSTILWLIFISIIVYFIFIKSVWKRPSGYSLVFTGLVLLMTLFICFAVLNFWQIYSTFM